MSQPKRRICAVVTARPSYSRIKTALLAIRDHRELELSLVVAASALLDRYGNPLQFMADDGLVPTAKVYMVLEGSNLAGMAKTTGIGLMELATVFDNLKPDFVLSVADRYETMATAVAAAYMNIPLVHVQGGEVTGSIDEKVRHAITKLADYHFVSTPAAAERVLKMGELPERIHVTGCPSIDLSAEVLSSPALDFDPIARYGGVGKTIDLSQGYLVVLQHPVTTEHELARDQAEMLMKVILETNQPTCWFWPNVDAGSDGTSKGIRSYRERFQPANIHFFKNMEGRDFLRLLCGSRCLVGNSSVGIRECSYLGVPVVNLGVRQAGRERGRNVLDVGHDPVAIRTAIQQQLAHGRYPQDSLYGDGQAGPRIANLLARIEPVFEKRLAY